MRGCRNVHRNRRCGAGLQRSWTTPLALHSHSLSGCFAFPGVSPFHSAVTPISPMAYAVFFSRTACFGALTVLIVPRSFSIHTTTISLPRPCSATPNQKKRQTRKDGATRSPLQVVFLRPGHGRVPKRKKNIVQLRILQNASSGQKKNARSFFDRFSTVFNGGWAGLAAGPAACRRTCPVK